MILRKMDSISVDVPGFTNDKILGFLYDCVIAKQPQDCLEIGTFMGRSAYVICQALESIGGDHGLYCIDFYVQDYSPNYLNTRSKKYMINRCGPEIAALYTDFERLTRLEDCFHLTIERKPLMKKYVSLVKADSSRLDFSSIPVVDFAYIDGDHTYEGVRTDTLNTLSRLNPNGMIVFDDYLERFDGVVRFVDEFSDADTVKFEGREGGDVAYSIGSPEVVRRQLSTS